MKKGEIISSWVISREKNERIPRKIAKQFFYEQFFEKHCKNRIKKKPNNFFWATFPKRKRKNGKNRMKNENNFFMEQFFERN